MKLGFLFQISLLAEHILGCRTHPRIFVTWPLSALTSFPRYLSRGPQPGLRPRHFPVSPRHLPLAALVQAAPCRALHPAGRSAPSFSLCAPTQPTASSASGETPSRLPGRFLSALLCYASLGSCSQCFHGLVGASGGPPSKGVDSTSTAQSNAL